MLIENVKIAHFQVKCVIFKYFSKMPHARTKHWLSTHAKHVEMGPSRFWGAFQWAIALPAKASPKPKLTKLNRNHYVIQSYIYIQKEGLFGL